MKIVEVELIPVSRQRAWEWRQWQLPTLSTRSEITFQLQNVTAFCHSTELYCLAIEAQAYEQLDYGCLVQQSVTGSQA